MPDRRPLRTHARAAFAYLAVFGVVAVVLVVGAVWTVVRLIP